MKVEVLDLSLFHSISIPESLYIHYPICKHVCSYCDFNVYSAPSIRNHETYSDTAWLSALDRHWTFLRQNTQSANPPLKHLYLGGGTPSLMSETSLQALDRWIKSNFQTSDLTEFTMEMNPENVTKDFLQKMKTLGVNRPSLGVQTFQPQQLRRLERLVTHEHINRALRWMKDEFETFSMDLMIGIPDQTIETLKQDLGQMSDFDPPHVSIYVLTLSPDSRLKKKDSISKKIASDEEAKVFYETACDWMSRHGYEHYEVSNFCRPGFASQHNANYWNVKSDYLALGPGGHGYLKLPHQRRIRYENIRDLRSWSTDRTGIGFFEELDAEQQRLESLYLRLRTRTPIPLSDVSVPAAKRLENEGLAKISGQNLVLNEKAWIYMESIAAQLI